MTHFTSQSSQSSHPPRNTSGAFCRSCDVGRWPHAVIVCSSGYRDGTAERERRAWSCGPVAPPEAVRAINDGQPLSQAGRVLDIAKPSMFVGGDCSATDPCWVGCQEMLAVADDDGILLRSTGARA